MLQQVTLPLPDAILNSQSKNKYRLLHLLGAGGTGSVFKALQESTGQIVAVKLLHQSPVTDQGQQLSQEKTARMTLRFERETSLCAQLHHPHIVKLLDRGQTEHGHLFAVFEFVPGETLNDLLTRKVALSAPEAGELMGQVLDALACAHAKGIAHRDLKPHNIMVSTTGTRRHVKVLDFGIASFIHERQRADHRHLTLTQEAMCSPAYSAPEQLRGEPPTVKMDLYAWGLLFLECLTGQPAIVGSTVAEVFHQQLSSTEVPLPSALLGHPLAELLRRVLRKNPLERTSDARLLYQDFQKINLANIVGKLLVGDTQLADRISSQTFSDLTLECVPGWYGLSYERQQITVLCCSLHVSSVGENGNGTFNDHGSGNGCDAVAEFDIDMLETLQRDQHALCVDTAQRFGAHVVGSLGNSTMFFFGYPNAASDDGRRAARTALDLISQVRRRNALLSHQGFSLGISVGIHTGMVRCMQGHVPSGVAPNLAWQLERMAEPGEVLVSLAARKLLDQFVEFEAPIGTHQSDEKKSSAHLEQIVTTDVVREVGHAGKMECVRMVGEHKSEALSFLNAGCFVSVMQGREYEYSQLLSAWEYAKMGLGQAFLLQGEAGIGKSRLVVELYRFTRSQDSKIREWRCLPEHQNNALFPVLEMLKTELHLHDANDSDEAVVRVQRRLTELDCDVAAILPILCSWLSLPIPLAFPAQAFSPERQKSMLLATLQRIILSGTMRDSFTWPSLLIVEDLHWMDQTSLELLTNIIAESPRNAMMLLLTARPHFEVPWQTGLTRIEIQRLSASAVQQLIEKQLPGKSIETTSLARIAARTDGIPLFAQELTRMLLENKLLIDQNGVFHLDERFDVTDIPVTLRDLLSARLAQLGSARESAQLASAIGREFDYNLLIAISLADEASVQNDLEQMVALGLIYRQRRVQGDSYIFHHALVRDAAYDSMSNKVRAQTHARIAQQIESRSEAEIERDLASLAHHFSKAHLFESAVNYGTRAAQRFLERTLSSDAIVLTELVQTWIDKLPPEDRRGRQIIIGRIFTMSVMLSDGWGSERAKQAIEYELSLVEGESAQLVLPSLCGAALYHNVVGHRSEARSKIEQCIELAKQSDYKDVLGACIAMQGFFLWLEGEYQQAETVLERALNDFDPLSHAAQTTLFGLDTHMIASSVLSNIKWFTELDADRAFDSIHTSIAWQRELNHIPSLGLGLQFQALIYQYSGDIDKTIAKALELQELARKYSIPALEGYINIVYAWCVSDLALCDQVLTVLRQLRCMSGYTYYHSLGAELAARAGDWDDALARIQRALELAEEMGELYYVPELLLRRAQYRAHTPLANPQLSRDDLLQAIEFAQAKGMKRCVLRAHEQLDILDRLSNLSASKENRCAVSS